MKVLVVDDNEVIVLLLSTLLKHDGHNPVEVYPNLRDLRNPASDYWDDADAIICDLRMPNISGLEILAVAKLYFPHVYRIALTAYSDPDALADLYRLANEVRVKPEGIADVIDIINGLARPNDT